MEKKFVWNKQKIAIFVLIDILIVAALVTFFIMRGQTKKEVHYHAGFQIYVNNVLQDFSDLKYQQIKPCGGIFDHEDDQIEKAHLHDNIGNVVHVHRDNAVWGDLLKNIKFQIPEGKEFVGYLNGTRKDDILTYPILPYDSVVFFSGPIIDMNHKLQARVTDDAIKEVEKKSENCGSDKK